MLTCGTDVMVRVLHAAICGSDLWPGPQLHFFRAVITGEGDHCVGHQAQFVEQVEQDAEVGVEFQQAPAVR